MMHSRLIFLWVLLVLFVLVFWGDQVLVLGALSMAITGRFIVLLRLERWLLLVLFMLLPFSLDWELFPGSKLNFPAEGLIILLFFTCLFKLLEVPLNVWPSIFRKYLSKSLFVAIVSFLLVMAWSVFHSSMWKVSVKFFIVNILFVSVGFGYTYICLKKNIVRLKELLLAITMGLSLVSLYAISNTILYGIGRNVAPALARPFFNDHTHFAATVLLTLPLVVYLWKTEEVTIVKRWYLLAIGIMTLSLVVTFSRASWLGAVIMVVGYLIFYFRIKAKVLVLFCLPLVLLFVLNAKSIKDASLVNKNDSNRSQSTLFEQLKSVTNLTSDASNMERINRWKCAIRMGEALPLWGFGPGTYQFQYFPFQRKTELTKISVTSPYIIKEGRGGTAHSEYLLAFSESGYPGLLSWIMLVGAIFYSFFSVRRLLVSNDDLFLLQMVFLGFIGYFIHAFMNNFLNTANFGLYFWMILAILMFLIQRSQEKINTDYVD